MFWENNFLFVDFCYKIARKMNVAPIMVFGGVVAFVSFSPMIFTSRPTAPYEWLLGLGFAVGVPLFQWMIMGFRKDFVTKYNNR
ncbi:MAG: hypothetical protein HOH05_14240 [Marinovum sp.]|nr:hypothetical protein [Marinovum sp.]